MASTETNNGKNEQFSKNAIDGKQETSWTSSVSNEAAWLTVILPGATEVTQIKLLMGTSLDEPIKEFAIQTFLNGNWHNKEKFSDNEETKVTINFKQPILTDRLRLAVSGKIKANVHEFEIYGIEYVSKDATPVNKIVINQSGYNLGKPKRFTAPEVLDNTVFHIINTRTLKKEFQGKVNDHIGDFSDFNPLTSDSYKIVIDSFSSYPFKFGPYWLERVTYQNMVDFMRGARHYTGTTHEIRRLSWAWRDGDFFNWSLQSLVAQYLSNPKAYERLRKEINYIPNSAYANAYEGKWGALEPYHKDAPDIVKLIHWDADVKISQQLDHEHQKAELAHFLYAYPYLKEWLPKQNFDLVYAYLKNVWTKPSVKENSTTPYDNSPEHNLLALKTKLGTTKGELPPGHSIIPNLMMYEVTKKQGEVEAEKYFKAAYNQIEWLIQHIDWKDPMSTKGQRMSEHMTMRAFAYFYNQYPNRAPKGLVQKVEDWAKLMINRSNNMWDFRTYTDTGDWVPVGWNETGNILGFPACALAAKSIVKNVSLQNELDRLVWSHFDNAFGRNPTGRHFSYDAPTEIEGVDLGWYNAHHGGVGLLEPVRFVFDGSPKTNHYPNHPEIGNYGWTEGWVQHNTAFNLSMAYLAYDDTDIQLIKSKKKTISIRLKAPLNFNEHIIDKVDVIVKSSSGDSVIVSLKEENPYSKYLVGSVKYNKEKIDATDTTLQIKSKDTISVGYGLGYFEKQSHLTLD
ncbi:discoidin domain-containing protein [Maribacter ulvicola]|nr:discoidin domain-containing protein [Maribacter ulvicola]